jgi:soluble lytic murein transglycosylase-like protein
VSDAPDPVPELFVKTWEQLAPELRRISENTPTSSITSYLSFITAGDALTAIQMLEEETGFILTADALRRMAHMIEPAETGDPLQYNTEVDPELREVFGFGPPLPPPEENPAPTETDQLLNQSSPPADPIYVVGGMPAALMLFFMPALIVYESAYQVLVNRMNGWVPKINALNEYLPQMQLLLDLVAQSTLQKKKLDSPFKELYRTLVLTTAWQESCWRQYVRARGEIIPIRSNAGAVGIMQINQHVWRGFYDIEGLQHNVGYNAEAGSEILHHYLVDYAIARGEQNHEGGLDNLMRATYAMYNGGPKHISRYRNENTSSSLRVIDKGFWEKFQKMRSGNTLAVAQCYSG